MTVPFLWPLAISEALAPGNPTPDDALRLPSDEWDLCMGIAQIIVDVAGIFDPTGIADATGMGLSIANGEYAGAAISLIGLLVPYVGDLAKLGKLPKWAATMRTAARLVAESPAFATKIRKPLTDLYQYFSLLPNGVDENLDFIKQTIVDILEKSGGVPSMAPLDISETFHYPVPYPDPHNAEVTVKEVAGRLGIPDLIANVRHRYSQMKMSSGTGDDAGHLLGAQYGPTGDWRNLSPQNWIQNEGSGAWHLLEDEWRDKLKSGTGILTRVRDYYRRGELRPYKRIAEWIEIRPDGTISEVVARRFANTSTDASRAGADAPAGILGELPGHTMTSFVDYVESSWKEVGREIVAAMDEVTRLVEEATN